MTELSRKRLEIFETQLTTRISQLEGVMYDTVIKETEQLSRKLDEKMIFCVNLWRVIFSKILRTASFKMILFVSRQDNHQMFQKILMVVSPPQCFECDTPSLKENTSANISQKENDFSIDLNKKN